MKPEVNALLEKVKQDLASLPSAPTNPSPNPTTPDFKTMSIMEATKWCLLEGGIDKPSEIAKLTGKSNNAVYTALWKIRNPKRVKVLQRRAKKAKAIKKAGIAPTPKAKPTKTKAPKIENGYYADGMETPFLDALNRQRIRYDLFEKTIPTNNESELMAENRRLKILVDHYESLLFKGGK
jgi:hypothetical protein